MNIDSPKIKDWLVLLTFLGNLLATPSGYADSPQAAASPKRVRKTIGRSLTDDEVKRLADAMEYAHKIVEGMRKNYGHTKKAGELALVEIRKNKEIKIAELDVSGCEISIGILYKIGGASYDLPIRDAYDCTDDPSKRFD